MLTHRTQHTGLVASKGMALGRAVHLPDFEATVPRKKIISSEVEDELLRFNNSLEESEEQLARVTADSNLPEEHRAIFEAQAMLLRDPMLVDPTISKIKSELINTEWALAGVLDSLKSMLRNTTDPVIRERVSDLEDIGNRIISNLMDINYDDIRIPFVENLPPGSILIAESISPSLMLQMGRDVAGIVTEKGGVTGHMAILCRDRGIPALVGIPGLRSSVPDQSDVLLDSVEGAVIVYPDESDRSRYEAFKQENQNYNGTDIISPVFTADGDRVRLWVNLDNEEDAMSMHVVGVTGVGLFRTEFLYLKNPLLLDQYESQIEAYASILKFLKGKIVTFRLLDLGDDKTLHAPIYRHVGAATDSMSLRGIRFLLANRAILKLQVGAIIEAAMKTETPPDHCRIMIPMVTRLEEIIEVRDIIGEVRSRMERESNRSIPEFPLGIMLETPAACLMADQFSDYVDFFSLGTNDLAQYTLALSRGESRKEDDQFYQPALFRMIKIAVDRARRPLSICGEIAGMTELIPILVGMGIRDLSVSVAALPRTYGILGDCRVSGCGETSMSVLEAKNAQEVRNILGV